MKEHIIHAGVLFGVITLFVATGIAQDAKSCGECHVSAYREWLQSGHAQSWQGERFQTQMESFGNPDLCGACHGPGSIWQSVQEITSADPETPARSIGARLNEPPSVRDSDLGDGVGCASCHLIEVAGSTRTSNQYVGPFHTEGAHRGYEVAEFRTFKLCAGCHGQTLADVFPEGDSLDEGFYHSKLISYDFVFEGTDCRSCHMPVRKERLVTLHLFEHHPVREVGDHNFMSPRSQGLADALEMNVAFEGDRTLLSVANSGIGHPLRISADTQYRLLVSRLENGKVVQTEAVEIIEAEALLPGETKVIPLPFAPETGSLRLELLRKHGDASEELIFRKEL